jgi:hypothetical protein
MLLSPGKYPQILICSVFEAYLFTPCFSFASSIGSAPGNLKNNSGIWSKFKRKPNEWDGGAPSQPPPPMGMGMGMNMGMNMNMGGGGAVMRQRFLTLVHGDMETIKLMPNSYAVSDTTLLLLNVSLTLPLCIGS